MILKCEKVCIIEIVRYNYHLGKNRSMCLRIKSLGFKNYMLAENKRRRQHWQEQMWIIGGGPPSTPLCTLQLQDRSSALCKSTHAHLGQWLLASPSFVELGAWCCLPQYPVPSTASDGEHVYQFTQAAAQTGGLKQQTLIFPLFWRLGTQDQGTNKVSKDFLPG